MVADVGAELDAHAVRRDGRQRRKLGVVRLALLLLLDLLAVARERHLVGAHKDVAALAVDDDECAVRNLLQAITDADDRRNRARLGNDDGVARRAALP